jgi:hypothetical protein
MFSPSAHDTVEQTLLSVQHSSAAHVAVVHAPVLIECLPAPHAAGQVPLAAQHSPGVQVTAVHVVPAFVAVSPAPHVREPSPHCAFGPQHSCWMHVKPSHGVVAATSGDVPASHVTDEQTEFAPQQSPWEHPKPSHTVPGSWFFDVPASQLIDEQTALAPQHSS